MALSLSRNLWLLTIVVVAYIVVTSHGGDVTSKLADDMTVRGSATVKRHNSKEDAGYKQQKQLERDEAKSELDMPTKNIKSSRRRIGLQMRSKRAVDSQPPDSLADIAFDLPDLTIIITGNRYYQVNAFKSGKNDAILAKPDKSKPSQMHWVTAGRPMLVKVESYKNASIKKLFHANMDTIFTHVQLATNEHREKLAERASHKYELNITSDQITIIPLEKFQCSLKLYDDLKKGYLIKGEVKDFQHFPLKLSFAVMNGSKEGMLFAASLDEDGNADIEFDCRMSSKGKRVSKNTLEISSEQVHRSGLEDKLFGLAGNGSDGVFVTRNQLTDIAAEMYSSLNILEDYEMPEKAFSSEFIDGMISQIASSNFRDVPIDEALASFSKYGMKFDEDLKPDVIKKELSSILKVGTVGNKNHIVKADENRNEKSSDRSKSGGGSVEASFGGFGAKAAANFAVANSNKENTESKTLSDQLHDLNTNSQSDIKWEIEGEKVIPKSINVARFQRSSFRKKLEFKRVNIERYDAPFAERFMLSAHSAKIVHTFPDENAEMSAVKFKVSKLEENFSKLREDLKIQLQQAKEETAALRQGANDLKIQLQREPNRQNASNDWNYRFQQASSNWQRQLESLTSTSRSSIEALSRRMIKRCRICYYKVTGDASQGGCSVDTTLCSGWSDSPSYTNTYGAISPWFKCNHIEWVDLRWKLECEN